MSSVSDQQIKSQPSSVKNVEERTIPWSQQVHEASYEEVNLTGLKKKNDINSLWEPQQSNHNNSRKGRNFVEWPRTCNKDGGREEYYKIGRESGNTVSDKNGTRNQMPVEDGDKVNHQVKKQTTWASIASQPAKLISRTNSASSAHKKKGPGMPPPPMVPGKHNLDIGTWDLPGGNPVLVPPTPPVVIPVSIAHQIPQLQNDIVNDSKDKKKHFYIYSNNDPIALPPQRVQKKIGNKNVTGESLTHLPNEQIRPPWIPQEGPQNSFINMKKSNASSSLQFNRKYVSNHADSTTTTNEERKNVHSKNNIESLQPQSTNQEACDVQVLEELKDKNNYNPGIIDLEKASKARFFVIKSYSEDDIHRSIKYEIWCSTDHGNKRLDDAFLERTKENGYVFLLFSVNGSGHFCGMAQMMTPVDYNSISSVWSQDKWKGKFKVKWIYVKDVPNSQLRHIRLENNENKSVTNSRDTQEVPNVKGIQVLKILHAFKHQTSIFDDFYHYEKRQEEEVSKKPVIPHYESNSESVRINRHSNDVEKERNSSQNKHTSGGFHDRYNFSRGGHHSHFYDNRRNESYKRSGSFETSHYNQNRENSDYINKYDKRVDKDMVAQLKYNRERCDDFNPAGLASRNNVRGFNDNYKNRDLDHPQHGRGREPRN